MPVTEPDEAETKEGRAAEKVGGSEDGRNAVGDGTAQLLLERKEAAQGADFAEWSGETGFEDHAGKSSALLRPFCLGLAQL